MSINYLEVLPENYYVGKHCSRCGKKFSKKDNVNLSHGWDVFCDVCEKAFTRWMKRGKKI